MSMDKHSGRIEIKDARLRFDLRLAMTAEGGAAPPVAIRTVWANVRRTVSGAWISIDSTTGAPHIWVTSCSWIAGKISAGSTRRRQTCVPPASVTAQV